MKLKIEKERVLEAAKTCPLFDSQDDMDLSNFCRKAFGNSEAIKIAMGALSFSKYDVEILNVDHAFGSIIVFKHSK